MILLRFRYADLSVFLPSSPSYLNDVEDKMLTTEKQQQVDEGIDAVIVDSVLKIRNGLTKNAKQADPKSFSAATSGAVELPAILENGAAVLSGGGDGGGVGEMLPVPRIMTPVGK